MAHFRFSRTLLPLLRERARQFPAIILTGPRQSGKTTLCRMAWPGHDYLNLERPDLRSFADSDPRAFLADHPNGAILDEVQRVPDLTSWLQVLIDEDPVPGRWILTGSEQLTLTQRTSQSLAGRATYAHLLPFDMEEQQSAGLVEPGPASLPWARAVLRGGYPAPWHQPVPIDTWLEGYVQSYLERDVRNLLAIADLGRFQTFIALLAGSAGQLTNFSRLGADAGITHPTAKSWLSVLEASFLATHLRPWHGNLGKRLTKTPKVFFWDSGLVCHLLHIRNLEQLAPHPLRGSLFEGWAIAELLKVIHHRGATPEAYFYRDQGGLEVDLLLRREDHWAAIEFKSGLTASADSGKNLHQFLELCEGRIEGLPVWPYVIYGGNETWQAGGIRHVPWTELTSVLGQRRAPSS